MAWMAGARMLRFLFRLQAFAVAALLMTPAAWGQRALSTGSQTASLGVSQTVTDVLHQMSDRADVIFMGQVLAVRLPVGASPGSGVVEVDFRVDRAIRGCKASEPYALREWGGLWVGSSQRYRVGQRLLMFLHAPGAGGLSSPVDGLDGAIPIRQTATGTSVGETAAPLAEIAALQPTVPFVDLRWLGARVSRTISYRSEAARAASTFAETGLAQQEVVTADAWAGDSKMILPLGYTSASEASTPAQQASVEVVLGLLTTWEEAQHVTP